MGGGDQGLVFSRGDFQPLFVYQDCRQIVDPDLIGRSHEIALGGGCSVDQAGDLHGGGFPHGRCARRPGTQLFVFAGFLTLTRPMGWNLGRFNRR